MKSVEAQGGRGKKQLNAQNLQGIQLISMSRQEGETRKGKRRVYRMWIGRLWTCDGWSRGMEETWMGQPGWLQATRWSGGNTCRSARSWGGEQQQRQPFHLLRHRGRKETTGVGVHLLSLSVPSSFSQLVCGSLQWRLLPPSAAGQNWNEITNNKKTTLKSRRVSSRVKYMIVKWLQVKTSSQTPWQCRFLTRARTQCQRHEIV